MVVLHVKRDQSSLFLLEGLLSESVEDTLRKITRLHNGRLKVLRLCDEVESLSNHGIFMPPEMLGLLVDQIADLKLVDEEGDRCLPSGGFELRPDPVQRRNGKAPNGEMREVLERTVTEVRLKMSPENVKANVSLSWSTIKECLDILRGAVTIVYPMGLPKYDPVQEELENREEINERSHAGKEVVDIAEATLWFANKEMKRDELLAKYMGKNEKTKVVVKLSTKRHGQPVSESWLSPNTQKKLAVENFKRMEELKKLERDSDDSYLNSTWADGNSLKKKFQGLNNISWKP